MGLVGMKQCICGKTATVYDSDTKRWHCAECAKLLGNPDGATDTLSQHSVARMLRGENDDDEPAEPPLRQ